MAKATDIPAPLSDRTLAHGRNVMAAASVILVLAYVPDIEIKSFSPLGFDFDEGGELSVWGILAVVLVYYAIRFGFDCWVDYTGWRHSYRDILVVYTGEDLDHRGYTRHARWLRTKFWFLDVAPPAVMFLLALAAAVYEVVPLVWSPPSPPLL